METFNVPLNDLILEIFEIPWKICLGVETNTNRKSLS